MITRKENLLIRPWQQKHYDDHRKKIEKMQPAIDNKAPLPRQHVYIKKKKIQKEMERIEEIEKNNLHLLRRLGYVKRTSRVDNIWTVPHTKEFLSRIAMFENVQPKYELVVEESRTVRSGRRGKCSACTPNSPVPTTIPEDRVPWEPPRPSFSRRRSQSVPVVKTKPVVQKVHSKSAGHEKTKSSIPSKSQNKVHPQEIVWKEPTNVVFSRGCLKLELNFPSNTLVTLRNGRHEKTLLANRPCNCTAVKT